MIFQGLLSFTNRLRAFRDLGSIPFQTTKAVQQLAMAFRINQRTVIMLTMNLNQQCSDLPQQASAHRRVIYKRTGTTIRRLHAAQDDVGVMFQIIFLKKSAQRMRHWNVKNRSHLTAVFTMPNQSGISSPTKGEAQTVKKNRLTCTGLTRQNTHSIAEMQVQLVNENDIPNRKRCQHGSLRHPDSFKRLRGSSYSQMRG